MSNENATETTTPQQLLDEARANHIRATKKIVIKKMAMYGALIAGVIAVERLTRVEIDETEESTEDK